MLPKYFVNDHIRKCWESCSEWGGSDMWDSGLHCKKTHTTGWGSIWAWPNGPKSNNSVSELCLYLVRTMLSISKWSLQAQNCTWPPGQYFPRSNGRSHAEPNVALSLPLRYVLLSSYDQKYFFLSKIQVSWNMHVFGFSKTNHVSIISVSKNSKIDPKNNTKQPHNFIIYMPCLNICRSFNSL